MVISWAGIFRSFGRLFPGTLSIFRTSLELIHLRQSLPNLGSLRRKSYRFFFIGKGSFEIAQCCPGIRSPLCHLKVERPFIYRVNVSGRRSHRLVKRFQCVARLVDGDIVIGQVNQGQIRSFREFGRVFHGVNRCRDSTAFHVRLGQRTPSKCARTKSDGGEVFLFGLIQATHGKEHLGAVPMKRSVVRDGQCFVDGRKRL